MAITRQTTQILAAAEINDDYGVDVTVHRGREKLTVKLTQGEAFGLVHEIQEAALTAARTEREDGAS